MEIQYFKQYKPIETALMGVGYKVDKVIKQQKKTIIIVSNWKKGEDKK